MHSLALYSTNILVKQGVTLMGRNTTGPPSRAAPWWITVRHREVLQTTTDGDGQTTTDHDRRLSTQRYCPLHYM